ncbi:hypothetical protein F4859DRAFT_196214 [Xylaria cf. heliscus]|nr:hypothetical protein F4859DRAFT_196214 [Xylaria cf. heliscus]
MEEEFLPERQALREALKLEPHESLIPAHPGAPFDLERFHKFLLGSVVGKPEESEDFAKEMVAPAYARHRGGKILYFNDFVENTRRARAQGAEFKVHILGFETSGQDFVSSLMETATYGGITETKNNIFWGHVDKESKKLLGSTEDILPVKPPENGAKNNGNRAKKNGNRVEKNSNRATRARRPVRPPTASPGVRRPVRPPTASPGVHPAALHPAASPGGYPAVLHPAASPGGYPAILHPAASPGGYPAVFHPTGFHPTGSSGVHPNGYYPDASPGASPVNPDARPNAYPNFFHPDALFNVNLGVHPNIN